MVLSRIRWDRMSLPRTELHSVQMLFYINTEFKSRLDSCTHGALKGVIYFLIHCVLYRNN